MRSRRGFTLIEVLIAMAILMVISGLVYPKLNDLVDIGPSTTYAYTVRQIRQMILYHGELADGDLSKEGYPDDIDAAWFPMGKMPSDPWTMQPLKVQTVNGGKTEKRPNNIHFQINPNGKAAGHTAWYNKSNGAFCVKVPDQGSDDETEELFEIVNGLSAGGKKKGNNGNGNGNNGNNGDDNDDNDDGGNNGNGKGNGPKK